MRQQNGLAKKSAAEICPKTEKKCLPLACALHNELNMGGVVQHKQKHQEEVSHLD